MSLALNAGMSFPAVSACHGRTPTVPKCAGFAVKVPCPIRVNRVGLTAHGRLPLYPDQRTPSDRPGWSGSCQHTTSYALATSFHRSACNIAFLKLMVLRSPA